MRNSRTLHLEDGGFNEYLSIAWLLKGKAYSSLLCAICCDGIGNTQSGSFRSRALSRPVSLTGCNNIREKHRMQFGRIEKIKDDPKKVECKLCQQQLSYHTTHAGEKDRPT